jgi:hypothetical protein
VVCWVDGLIGFNIVVDMVFLLVGRAKVGRCYLYGVVELGAGQKIFTLLIYKNVLNLNSGQQYYNL